MTPKEFFKRWGEGIRQVTQLQLTFQQLIGQVIVLVGIIVGIITSLMFKQWWLLIILVGSFIVAGTSLIGIYQKYFVLKKFQLPIQEEDIEKEVVNEQESVI